MAIWQAFVLGFVCAAIGFVGGAVTMRVLYRKALEDKEARIATILERMDVLGGFIKNEILHVPEPDEEQKQKK
jgi:hypothetical protein